MYLILFFLFLIVPAVLGVAEILHLLKLAILSSKDNSYTFTCIFLEEENAIINLKTFCEEHNWNGMKIGNEFIAIYKELSLNVLDECRVIAAKNDIEFLKLDEFYKKIKEF